MKKSLLALSAAALVGGFATSAHAIVIKDHNAADATADKLATVEQGGVGHILFTPYYSTVNGNTTLISLVNTDLVNGKAVKVRFRGAANSDDVLDFTVLMSPGDVWTASIEPSASGVAKIISPDSTCVLPRQIGAEGVDFRTFRLDQKLSAEAQAYHTREGYVEFLNMADIVPGTTVFKAVKHVNNKAPCTPEVMDMLMSLDEVSHADAADAKYGLSYPTGQLFGNWSIFNNQSVTSYGGGHASVRAVTNAGANAAARLFFAPQMGGDASADAAANTADPLLVGGFAGATQPWGGATVAFDSAFAKTVNPLWLDLPDLSTPYTKEDTSPQVRANKLSEAIAATAAMNEFVATDDAASVPFSTDWVFSQPTRRYQVAMAYSASTSTEKNMPVNAVASANIATQHYFAGTGGNLSVRSRLAANGVALGDILCAAATLAGTNREELTVRTEGDFSPVPTVGASRICGEVATLTFNRADSKVLHANLTNERVNIKDGSGAYVEAGWATLGLKGAGAGLGLPVVGYAATAFTNGNTGGNYGDAITHRFQR